MSKIVKILIFLVILAFLIDGYFLYKKYFPKPEKEVKPEIKKEEQEETFRWGVTLRPFALKRYSQELLEEQLQLASDLSLKWIRLNWHDWHPQPFEFHDQIIDSASQKNLSTLLIIDRDFDIYPLTPEEVEKRAYKLSSKIARHYKDKLTHYQLGTELGSEILKSPFQAGVKFEDYQPEKYKKILAWLKGASEGIKKADPKAKRLINEQWIHVGFIEQIIKDGIEFEILGWNWFSDHGNQLSQVGNEKVDLLSKFESWQKEVWIVELNRRDGDYGGKEKEQAEYIKTMAKYFYNSPAIKGVFVFQLLDDADRIEKKSKDGYMGLVRLSKDKKEEWQIASKKAAFKAYQEIITSLRE